MVGGNFIESHRSEIADDWIELFLPFVKGGNVQAPVDTVRLRVPFDLVCSGFDQLDYSHVTAAGYRNQPLVFQIEKKPLFAMNPEHYGNIERK